MKAGNLTNVRMEPESFDSITEEEIVHLWRNFKTSGLPAEEAWNAVVIGMALDMAFSRTQAVREVTQ